LRYQTTVCQAACANFHRFEKAWKRAARTDGVHERPLRKDDRIERSQVGRDYSHRNTQFFEFARFEHPVHQVSKAIIAGKPEAGNTPACDVAKFQGAAGRKNFGEWRAARIGGPENAADARPGNMGNGNVILLENLQDSKVGKTAGKSAP